MTGLQQRSVLNSLIYKKAMRLTNDARNEATQVPAATLSPALPEVAVASGLVLCLAVLMMASVRCGLPSAGTVWSSF